MKEKQTSVCVLLMTCLLGYLLCIANTTYTTITGYFLSFVQQPLNQCFFDSVHRRLADSIEHMHVSICLHNWLIDLYRDTRGYDHPNKRKWRKEDVVDLNDILGNPHQAGWDCGLHTCIIPVMIQAVSYTHLTLPTKA